MTRRRKLSLASSAVALVVAACMLLASVRQPAFGPAALTSTTARTEREGMREVPPEPIRKPGGATVARPSRLQPPDMPSGPELPSWSEPLE